MVGTSLAVGDAAMAASCAAWASAAVVGSPSGTPGAATESASADAESASGGVFGEQAAIHNAAPAARAIKTGRRFIERILFDNAVWDFVCRFGASSPTQKDASESKKEKDRAISAVLSRIIAR